MSTIARKSTPEANFSFRSDRLSLDFAATLMFRGSSHPQELLDSPARLTAWALGSGALSSPVSCGTEVLRDAVRLREAIYRTALADIVGRHASRSDLSALNRHGQAEPVAVALKPDGTVTRSGTMDAVLASIGRDAIELLGGQDAPRLRQCQRDGCTRMFVDRSHGRNRTWCGMRECGNRVNAAAYRRRQRHGEDPS